MANASATTQQLQQLYVAYFGRAADPNGLEYWEKTGISTAKFAADMYAQAEFKDVYGSLSVEAQVNQIYKNLFDRAADTEGLNYWTLEINLGNLQLAEIATHLIWAAENNSGSSTDKTALENRTAAAVAYTAKVNETAEAILAYQADQSDCKTYMLGIDADTAHTDAGIAASVTDLVSGKAATYTITADSSSVDEGSTLTTSIATENVAAGTTLYWSLSGTGVSSDDLSEGALTGSGNVATDGSFSFSHTFASDATTEGAETVDIKLFSDSDRTTQVGSTTSVSISDTSLTPEVTAKTFTLTTGVNSGTDFTGTAKDDIYNANLVDSTNTLNAFDKLAGGEGTDTLYVDIRTGVTPLSLSGIEVVNATFSGDVTFGLSNASSVTNLTNTGSNTAATFTSVPASATSLTVQDVASNSTTFTYLTTTGTQTLDVAVNNVTGGANSEISLDGIEKLTFTGNVAASTYEIAADAATELNFAGSQDQTVTLDATTLSVSKFDASSATGAISLTTVNQTGVGAGTDQSVLGGSGNDTLTLSNSTGQDVTVSGGAGNDTIVHTTLASTDSVDGGDGTDTISMANAAAIALDGATRTTFTNVEAITITDHFDGSLTTQNIATSINTVNLTLANAAIIDEAETITGGAGAFTVNIGNSSTSTDGVIGAALTITDTGSATTDSLTIANKAKLTTGANLDILNTNNITSTGYELVTFNTGSGSGTDQIDTGTFTITPDDTSGTPISFTVTGSNALDIATSLTTTSTGLMTVDASGMTAAAAGTDTLVITSTSQGTSGTLVFTGSAGDDTIDTGNFQGTLSGGAGDDTLTGGTVIDSITGGTGNDIIDGAGGNDILSGGAGNDAFTVSVAGDVNLTAGEGDDTVNMDSTLSSADTVAGGDGTDILAIDAAATASTSEGVTGFETLRIDTAALTQDMVQFTNNSTFTKIATNATGAHTINNVGSSLNTLTALDDTTTLTFDRLLDNTSNSLTFSTATDGATTITTLVVDDEDTLVFDDGAQTTAGTAFSIKALHAEDVVSITLTGASNFAIIDAIQAQATAYLTTIDASANTGTVDIDAANATLDITITASSTAASSMAGGTGADTINGGDAADTLTGNNGADSITGGEGADTISGSAGVDVIVGGLGADQIDGGAGVDTLTGGTGADDFLLYDLGTGADTITAGSGADTITGGDGADIYTFTSATNSLGDNLKDFSSADDQIAITLDYSSFGNGLDINAVRTGTGKAV